MTNVILYIIIKEKEFTFPSGICIKESWQQPTFFIIFMLGNNVYRSQNQYT